MQYKVGPKGQVVISKEARKKLGVGPGWTAYQMVVGDHLEIKFFPPPHNRSLAGILAPYVKRHLSDDELHDAEEQAWMDEAKRHWEEQWSDEDAE